MGKMHENEFEIDEDLVHALIKSQCSHWANLPLKAIISSGTDNALFHLGNEYDVLREGDIIVHDNPSYLGSGPSHSRNLQWLECCSHQKIYFIFNVHGLWNGMGKTDTPERIIQSQRIRNFMETINTPKILCGDFNLKPDTESMKILEDGMDNLIKIHNVNSTRTNLYPKDEKFADYILTSKDVTVQRFEVFPDEVSDHSPLFLDFS